MNNKKIIEFSFRNIWRILYGISEGVITLYLISIILQMILNLIQ